MRPATGEGPHEPEQMATPTLALVGGGRAARSLSVALERAGAPLAWRWTRSSGVPLEEQPEAALILLAVSDRAIEEVARALARRPSAPREVWLHLSGSRPGAVARADRLRPKAAGAFHPLQSLDGSAGAADALAGAVAGLDGDPEAVAAGARLARRLRMRPLVLDAAGKALYHAAAVMASGHAAALFAQACRTLARCGLTPEEARAALHPLLAGTVAHLARGPASAVQTGPVPRGDVATVGRHLRALAGLDDPRATAAYRTLGQEALALTGDDLPREVADALRALLRGADRDACR